MNMRTRQAEGSRAALLAAARDLFGQHGYEQTSLDDIVLTAHLTKGALYHHFGGKQDLFRAVYEGVEAELRRELFKSFPLEPAREGVWDRFCDANSMFLRLSAEPHIHQIRCVDGPAVLTWRGSLNVEGRGLQTFRNAIADAIRFGEIRDVPIEATALMLRSAMTEGSSYVAHAHDFEAALLEATAALRAMLDGYRARPADSAPE